MDVQVTGEVLRVFGELEDPRRASAYASDHRLILGQLKVESKENEIVALPKLLAMLNLRHSLVGSSSPWSRNHISTCRAVPSSKNLSSTVPTACCTR